MLLLCWRLRILEECFFWRGREWNEYGNFDFVPTIRIVCCCLGSWGYGEDAAVAADVRCWSRLPDVGPIPIPVVVSTKFPPHRLHRQLEKTKHGPAMLSPVFSPEPIVLV